MKDDSHLTILLDIQKQLGALSAETARQSEQINAVVEKQTELAEYQKYANGKTAKVISDVQELKDDKNIQKGKLAIIGAIAGSIASVIIGIIIKKF